LCTIAKYKITRSGDPIGDILLASLFVHVLNDNNIEAVFGTKCDIADCPMPIENEKYIHYDFKYKNEINRSIIESALQLFIEKFDITQNIDINRKFIPVNFIKDDTLESFDVVLVTKSGFWSEIRNWPFFDELKKMLTDNNITWKDITLERDQNSLNYVNNSKIFVSLETGSSHLASKLITKKKSLIIQSGYSKNSFWNFYDYDVIDVNAECSPCFLRSISECKCNHKCMTKISVDEVFHKIKSKLDEALN